MRIVDVVLGASDYLCLPSEKSATNHFNRLFFTLQLPEASTVHPRKCGPPSFPDEEGRFDDSHQPTDTAGRTVNFYLPKGRHRLFLEAFRPLHGSPTFRRKLQNPASHTSFPLSLF
jgi:hypothetical protein